MQPQTVTDTKETKREPPRTKHKGDAGGAATGQRRDGAERFLPHAQADCLVCTGTFGTDEMVSLTMAGGNPGWYWVRTPDLRFLCRV